MKSCWKTNRRERRRALAFARAVTRSGFLLLGLAHVDAVAAPMGSMGSQSAGSVRIAVTVRPAFNVVSRSATFGGTGYCMSSNLNTTGLIPRLRVGPSPDLSRELHSGVDLPWCSNTLQMRKSMAFRRGNLVIVEAQ